jgi:hypothetical protein
MHLFFGITSRSIYTVVTFDMQDSMSYAYPSLKMWDTIACATAKKITHFIISIAVLENVPPDAGQGQLE